MHMNKNKIQACCLRSAAAIAVAIVITISAASAQDRQVIFTPETDIRLGYESWSIFLVCNQQWLVPDDYEQLENLYYQFETFGASIGPNHLAVWFWKQELPKWRSPELVKDVDVGRSAKYCRAFNLRQREGPHVLVTTAYPDLDNPPEPELVISLANSSSQEIAEFLNDLSDKLIFDGLETKSADYWAAWFDAARNSITRLGENVKVVMKTPWFDIEVKGSGS